MDEAERMEHGMIDHQTPVTLQESCLPAAYSKSPNTPYALYTPYLFLVFAEYTPILLPILQRKHSLFVYQEQSRSTLRTLLRTALPLYTTVLLSHRHRQFYL